MALPDSAAESVISRSKEPLIFFLGGSTPVAGLGSGAGLPSADTDAVGARFAVLDDDERSFLVNVTNEAVPLTRDVLIV